MSVPRSSGRVNQPSFLSLQRCDYLNASIAQSDDFEGDDLPNNLFSNLAPLPILFGEQVIKQFLSMSTRWTDDLLLAMGPLGIITDVVSAT